jgi:hypothetical protein
VRIEPNVDNPGADARNHGQREPSRWTQFRFEIPGKRTQARIRVDCRTRGQMERAGSDLQCGGFRNDSNGGRDDQGSKQ